jgi:Tol biopolymer transport system component
VIVAKNANQITVFLLQNLAPTLEYHLDLPVAGSSTNDIISVSPDGCWVYYSWQSAGADQTDIYRIAIDGKRIVQVTNTQDASENEPFIANNWYLYMTSTQGDQTQVEGLIESSGKRWVVAPAAKCPSASPDGKSVTYHAIQSGQIAGAYYEGTAQDFSSLALTGSWNAWRPDGSGLILKDKAEFFTCPFGGNQSTFMEDAISSALRPAGGHAAILSTEKALSMYALEDWLITGEPVEIKPLLQAGFITWWSPGRMPYVPYQP